MDKEKDSREFFRLYTGVQKQLYAYLLMLVHNHDDAEDLLQETAGILWEKFDEFIEGSSFAAWAMGIARNRALDLMKLRRRSRPYFEDSVYEKLYIQAELTSDDDQSAGQCSEKLH